MQATLMQNLEKLLLTAPLTHTMYLIQCSYCAVVCNLVLTLVSQLAQSMHGNHVCMQQQVLAGLTAICEVQCPKQMLHTVEVYWQSAQKHCPKCTAMARQGGSAAQDKQQG